MRCIVSMTNYIDSLEEAEERERTRTEFGKEKKTDDDS